MTIGEVREILSVHEACNTYEGCVNCPRYGDSEKCERSTDDISRALEILIAYMDCEVKVGGGERDDGDRVAEHGCDDAERGGDPGDGGGDAVVHPGHYNTGKIEVWEAIDDWGLDFWLGNTVKYVARAGKKDDRLQDLRKARAYVDKAIELEMRDRGMV